MKEINERMCFRAELIYATSLHFTTDDIYSIADEKDSFEYLARNNVSLAKEYLASGRLFDKNAFYEKYKENIKARHFSSLFQLFGKERASEFGQRVFTKGHELSREEIFSYAKANPRGYVAATLDEMNCKTSYLI